MTNSAPSPMSPEQAAQALADVQSGRDAAARRLPTPWWYHPLLGLVLAVLVGSFALPRAWMLVVVAVALAGEMALFWLYRRLTGVWVNGSKIDGLRGPTALASVVALVLVLLAIVLERWWEVRGAAVACGVVLGTAYVVYWRWVERHLVRLWREAP